jgi:hypothetical protein
VRRIQLLIIAITLAAAVLGLGGCRRTETTTDKQVLPMVKGENSPLPTPGVADSPVTP